MSELIATQSTLSRAMAHVAMRTVPAAKLYVSEPPPEWFGNPRNEATADWTNGNWLKSWSHFGDYPRPLPSFGVLRVMSEDLVQPTRGFAMHGHRDMEIITYVVDGALTHQDSMGTKETLGRGSVQFMTAGRGIRHSEYNLSERKPLRFVQSWIVPRARGLTPQYGSLRGDDPAVELARRNAWAHLLSDVERPDIVTPVKIAQDANLFVTELEPGVALPLDVAAGRQAYLTCIDGTAAFQPLSEADAGDDGRVELEQHEGLEIVGGAPLRVTAGAEGAHLMYFEMAATGGSHIGIM